MKRMPQIKYLAVVAVAFAGIGTAAAQDMPTWDPSVEGLGRVMQHGVTEANRQRRSDNKQSAPLASRDARSICANKQSYQANLSPAKAQRLAALCARAGY
ncbi:MULTISPECIES: hypothetical protein [unclassified Sphingomonas]|uniref:hypothetical protein n=1 Tax=unclassified Sphingomonas TaxID=196159 RepID=UPI00082E5476|nr:MULTISPECIES: hypothetical protein [unclassified Sphingomonas]